MSTQLQVLVGAVLVLGLLALLVGVVTGRIYRRLRRAVSGRLRALTPSSRGARSPGDGRLGSRPPALTSLAMGARVRDTPAGVRVRASLPGRGRQIATLRRELALDLQGARRAVTAGHRDHRPVAGLQSVTVRRAEQARALDVDLAVIGSEPDPGTRRRLLAAQQERLTLLHRACGEIRRAVLLSGSVATVCLLRSMENDLNEEVIALALQARAYAELSGT